MNFKRLGESMQRTKSSAQLQGPLWRVVPAVLTVLLLVAAPGFALDESAALKINDADTLQYRLDKNGSARVIVKLNVPDYARLRSASQAFKVRKPGQGEQEARATASLVADKAMAGAIATVAGDVQGKIPQGAQVTRQYDFTVVPYALFEVDAEGLAALAAMPEVLAIAEDRFRPLPEPMASASGEPSEPSLSTSTALIGADDIWSQGYTGSGWYVGVLDTGVLTSHEMFNDTDISEACFVSSGYSSTRLCPNGSTEMIGTGAAAPYESKPSGYYHGTHVAGIAVGDNPDHSVRGVAPDGGLIAINVFTEYYGGLGAFDSDIIKGLEHVYSLRSTYSVASVNLSLGGTTHYTSACDTNPVAASFDTLYGAGISVLVATGNDSSCDGISSPACVSSAFAVGASDSSDTVASFSNWWDSLVPFFAPGVNILSAGAASNTQYILLSGTSMSTPMVAGAWALLKSYSSGSSLTEIQAALENTGQNVTFNRCSSPTGINRRIQLDQAAQELGGSPTPTPSTQADVWWHNTDDGQNLVWFMNGASKSTEGTVSTVSLWDLGCLADFDGDGETDAFWHDPSSGVTVLQYMTDITVSSQVTSVVIPAPWAVGGCGDFDADGLADVLWYNPNSGRNGVTYLNSSAQLKGDYGFLADSSTVWLPRGVGDFNGDSSPDVVYRNNNTGHVAIMLLDGITSQGVVSVTTIPTEWDIKGLGDFNDDGDTDLVWRNGVTGQNGVMFMDGTSAGSNSLFDTVAPSSGWDIGGAGIFH